LAKISQDVGKELSSKICSGKSKNVSLFHLILDEEVIGNAIFRISSASDHGGHDDSVTKGEVTKLERGEKNAVV